MRAGKICPNCKKVFDFADNFCSLCGGRLEINPENPTKGGRIRRIREMLNMTQAELGEKIGLDANRVQKYENGARNPGAGYHLKIAKALDVNPVSLDVPCVTDELHSLYALFELEDRYGFEPMYEGGKYGLRYSGENKKLERFLKLWINQRECLIAGTDEYYLWKFRFDDGGVE